LESGEFGEVVGEDAVAAPGSGSFDAGEAASVPSLLAFEAGDATLGPGSPSDLFSELGGVDLESAFLGRCALSGYGDEPDTDLVAEGPLHGGFPVAAVRGSHLIITYPKAFSTASLPREFRRVP
jgi:hypothetical protein